MKVSLIAIDDRITNTAEIVVEYSQNPHQRYDSEFSHCAIVWG
jgi:hypothetical protein